MKLLNGNNNDYAKCKLYDFNAIIKNLKNIICCIIKQMLHILLCIHCQNVQSVLISKRT